MSRKILLSALVVYILSTGLSYGAFRTFSQEPRFSVSEEDVVDPSSEGSLLAIDPKEPKDQPCPLNGELYTQTEKDAWSKKRPLAVMIENHEEARPQSGLSDADIVFEALAEGGVTRFMGIFYCGVQREDTILAPIRSARYYFVSYAAGFNRPLYIHVGGSNVAHSEYLTDALGFLTYIGWTGENDLNQFSIGYPTFVRDYNRLGADRTLATEHTMVTSTEKLWEVGADRGWTNMSPELKVGRNTIAPADWQAGYEGWSFQDDEPADGSVSTISYEFWDGFSEFGVKWTYDPATKSYKRVMGGENHIDLNNQEQIMARNVVVLKAEETGPVNEKKHMIYETTGTGDALIFKNGQVIEATWEKEDLTGELTFSVKGDPVEMARGLTWISVVSEDTDVNY